jgi:histidine ammonia-lyase
MASTPVSANWPACASSPATRQLQRNLILSHCCRRRRAAAMPATTADDGAQAAVRSAGARLGRHAGRPSRKYQDMLAPRAVTPVVPEPRARSARRVIWHRWPIWRRSMIGEGEAVFGGEVHACRRSAEGGLGSNLPCLPPRKALALINGTQFSTACALAGLLRGDGAMPEAAIVTSCLSTDAIMGSTAPLQAGIHALRGHPRPDRRRLQRYARADGGRRKSAKAIAKGDTRVQDPYCIRCQPQVTGAASTCSARRGDAGDRGQRRHRQSAGAGGGAMIVSGAISTPNRSPSPPIRSRSPLPRSAPSPSAASR